MSMDRARKETHGEQYLPEHLVENIVARIPFPSILKARQLSKEWKFKFSSVARQSFPSWPQYLARRSGHELVMYDPVLNCVKCMPLGSEIHSEDKFVYCHASCGSLLVAVYGYGRPPNHRQMLYRMTGLDRPIRNFNWSNQECASRPPEATVFNILTRQTKRIICPITRPIDLLKVLLVPIETDHYKLIFGYSDSSTSRYYSIVYSSSSASWETENQSVRKFLSCKSLYNDGSSYYIRHVEREPVSFVRMNIHSGAETKMPITVVGKVISARDYLVRCGSNIMAVVIDSGTFIVFKLDIESAALVEVSRTRVREEDWSMLDRGMIRHINSSNRVYLASFSKPLLYEYDVNSKTWSSRSIPKEFSMEGGSRARWYEPFVLELGLNPFAVP